MNFRGVGAVPPPIVQRPTGAQATADSATTLVIARDRSDASFEHAGVGMAEVDGKGILLRVNAQLCRLMDRTSDELVGRCIFDETWPSEAEADRDRLRLQAAGQIDQYSLEKRIRRREGSFFWASVTSTGIRDPDGRFLYAVRVQHDITQHKLAQAALAARMEEQAALHEFTERQQDAKSFETIYDAALRAITRALQCSRASILLFDRHGAMRFVAWRGLSDEYRRAVEGHSPWTPDSADARPICVDNAAQADLGDSLQRAVAAEKIGALAFIPIQESGRLLGKFMAYYDAPHAFTNEERDLALTLARQLGLGIESMRSRKAAQQLAAIVQSSGDAIVGKSLEGIITSWNRGAENLFGYAAEEVIGKPITILIPPDRISEEPGILARIRNGELVDHFETIRRRKDGSLIDISLTISPIRDAKGRIVGASKIARDVTERRKAEAEVRNSERRLQDLLTAIPAAIYTTDAAGKVTYYNQAAVDLAGRTPTIGSDEWCVTWKLFWPDGTPMPHDQCPMAVALREGREIRNVEAIAERPDGVRIPFIPYPTLLRDFQGRITGAINMLVDVSERKQAENQQRILLNELNHRVKNNLQMLQSLMTSSARRARNPEAQEVLNEASRRICAMGAAQRVLYDNPDATSFRAEDFLTAVCGSTQQTLPPDIEIACSASPGKLSNDVAMPLALILNELLTNAVKHGLKDRNQGKIRVGFRNDDGAFTLTVEDDGPGYDLASVRERMSGLRLIQGLVRQLRGAFEVTAGPGCRCTVRFS
ncbi:MAG: PAS domain S-box protein [Alphaproteobacteria bacterium]|nr:PAS domain S-box protein [Alphaproteobacteria bacterium]